MLRQVAPDGRHRPRAGSEGIMNEWWDSIYLRIFIEQGGLMDLDSEGRAIWCEVAAEEMAKHREAGGE